MDTFNIDPNAGVGASPGVGETGKETLALPKGLKVDQYQGPATLAHPLSLIDIRPQYLTKDGAWIIEGVGVAPDIEVVNPPKETYEGRDRQLETALKLLQDKLAKEPVAPLKPKGIPALRSHVD